MQLEHEETEKEDGYCTVADSGPSSEAIMEIVAQEETPAADEANETIAGVEICKDPENHESDEVSISVQSSDPNSASAIQPDTLYINTQFPVLIESSENKLSGSDDLYDTEQQIKMVSAAVPAPTSNKEITQGFEVNSSEQQGNEVLAVGSDTVHVQDTTIVDHEAGNGTDVDMSTCQSAEVEGDKDHATETVLECIQAPCDASDKDHSADLPATTLVTPEFNKITTCDMEVVCAGNSESSGNGESGTIGVQEAAAVADPGSMNDQALTCSGGGKSITSVQEAAAVADPGSMDGQALASSGGEENVTGVQEAAAVVDAGSTHDHEGDGTPGNVSQGTETHPSEQTKLASAIEAVSNTALVGYSSSEDSMDGDSAK
jgi:hypothetical protein